MKRMKFPRRIKSRRPWFRYVAILFLGVGVGMASCSVKEVDQDDPLISSGPHRLIHFGKWDETERVELKAAYFDTNKSDLKPAAKEALQYDAQWLKDHPEAELQIEGHCDERGSEAYNLALGERRAEAARTYLISLGIEGNRLFIVSYGRNSGKKDWDKQRKTDFVAIFPK